MEVFFSSGSTTSLIMAGTFAGLVAFFEYKRKFWLVFGKIIHNPGVTDIRNMHIMM
jgi:hypothetical protein